MNETMLDKLCAIPIFGAVPKEKMKLLAERMGHRKFKADSVLITEGEVGDSMCILLAGEVRVSKSTLDDEQYTIAIVTEDEHPFFGELAMLDEARRSATITATKSGELLVLERADFERFGNEHPEAALEIMRHLARRVSGELRRAHENAIKLFEALEEEVRSKEAR